MTADVSVLVCTLNRHEFIDQIFETIDAQTLQPAEIVFVDDGSEPPIVLPERDNITLIRLEENGGLANAQNIGVAAAKCRFIATLDSDDTWEPTKLEKQYQILSNTADDVFGVFTNYWRHGRKKRDGTSFREGLTRTPQVDDWFRYFLMGIRCGGSTIMFRREAFLEIGGIDTRMLRYEDWDFFLKATESGYYRFLTIDEPLANALLTGFPNAEKSRAALDMIEKRYMPRIKDTGLQRLFRAALAFERAACARWSGDRFKMVYYLGKSLASPALITRELKLTLNRS